MRYSQDLILVGQQGEIQQSITNPEAVKSPGEWPARPGRNFLGASLAPLAAPSQKFLPGRPRSLSSLHAIETEAPQSQPDASLLRVRFQMKLRIANESNVKSSCSGHAKGSAVLPKQLPPDATAKRATFYISDFHQN